MLRYRSFGLAGVCGLVVVVSACPGEGTGPNGNGNGNGTPTFAADIQPIFTARCALSNCHIGSSPAASMNLGEGQAHSNIVNVTSTQVPALNRVLPGNPEQSYLVLKIEGRAGEVGGVNTQMPLANCCLTSSQISAIREWITAGALNN
jgi:hypothetical protein